MKRRSTEVAIITQVVHAAPGIGEAVQAVEGVPEVFQLVVGPGEAEAAVQVSRTGRGHEHRVAG